MQGWLRKTAIWQAVLVIAILAWGLSEGLRAIALPAAQQRLQPNLNGEAFLAGRTAGAINHIMAHNLPIDPWARAAGGLFRWGLFRSGGPQVRVGCDGWLFLTEELRPWPDAEAIMAERVDALARIRDRLAARNIALLVAVVPDKARVHGDRLCGAPLSAQSAARYDRLMAALSAKDLAPVPLLPPLQALAARQDAYWRTDTHWNQDGAAVAAQAIAARAQGVGIDRPGGFATTRDAALTPGPGDLLRLMGLDILPDGLRPRIDRQHLARTREPEASGGLLDDAGAPQVTLIGSSYSVNANFHGALQEALGAKVTNLARAGGGFSGAASDYFAGATFRESPPRLIIWEIPERVIGQPITPEERAFFAR
ncbi:cell division protein FtsQ [Roseococcus sp. SYP-B2431]|uniref:alginate O-acetyltransferase AlgX-related protein n=1 Tax=Roseococcus sp. SYP-B2431 TaxID=2496640 RepID=UPI0010396C7F|nr:cell division protein FtsQ [Roseococcus sp. SYP-B2431]TCH96853.1 cell division protein FtsQ [Roseococcus sp. SYP-B2431]